MDNHDSHTSIDAIIAVNGLLKRYFNEACTSWHLSNPGQTSIYNMASLLGLAYPRAMTPATS